LVAAKIKQYTYSTVVRDLVNGNAYRKVQIPKKSGGMRDISVPTDRLKLVQKLILDNILYKLPTHAASHGGVRGKSVVTNATKHTKHKRKALIIDLKDFFPSITYKRINGVLLKMGFSWEVVRKLTPLLTYNKVLPQGAPTSTWISNAVCHRMDTMFSANNSIEYSRFVDDISITPTMHHYSHGKCMNVAVAIVENNGFEINRKKVRVGRSVCGVVIMDNRLTIPNRKYRKMRSMVHEGIKDIYAAAKHENMTKEKFEQHVSGNLEFAAQVRGQNGKGLLKLKTRWTKFLSQKNKSAASSVAK